MDNEKIKGSSPGRGAQALRQRTKELERALADAQHALASLTASERRCRTLFETAKDGIILVSSDTGSIIDVNQAFLDLAGYELKEVQGEKLWKIAPFMGTDAYRVAFQELQTKERILYDDLPLEKKDGGRISVELVCTSHKLDDQKIIQCTLRDITERKSIEVALWKAESRFRALFRHAAVGIAIMDLNGVIIESNGQMEDMLRYGKNELQGKNLSALTLPDGSEGDAMLYGELLRGSRESYQVVQRCLRKDGSTLWGLVNASLVRSRDGYPQFVVRTVADLSEQKKTEQALTESEERFRQIAETIVEVFWISSPDYSRVLYVSSAYEDVWGRTCDDLYEHPHSWIDAIHPDDRPRVMEALQGKERYEAEFRILRPDGGTRWIRDRGFPLKDASGRIYRIVGIAEDITERKRAEEGLRESEEKIRLLLNSTGEAIYGIDTEGTCIFCNPACIRMLGYAHQDELIGKNMHKLIHHSHKDGTPYPVEECRLMRTVLRGEGVRFDDEVLWRADGASFPAEILSYPQRRKGVLVGAVVTFVDITERKRTEEALQASEARFRDLAELLPQGIYEADRHGNVTYANRRAFTDFGYTPAEIAGGFNLLQTVIPEDRARVREAIERILAGDVSGGKEYTALRKDGTTFPVLIFSAPIIVSGQSRGLRGVFIDITERKRAEEALFQSESTLRSFYESAPVMMGVIELTDDDEIIHIYDNPATARFFGVHPESTGNRPAGDLGAPTEAIREWIARYRQSRLEKRPVHFEYIHQSPAGPLWLSATVASIGPGPTGRWRFSYVAEDVTEHKRAEEDIRQANELLKIQATTDVLTGIYNRLKFTDFLDQEIREARRYRHPLSLIMFDIDFFKRINDELGHHAGDDVLRETARLVAANIRDADIFARWGGDEFMILSPHSGLEQTTQLADKLRSLVERHPYTAGTDITCSFGVSQFAVHDTIESFTRRADIAMYKAKAGGRNRVDVVSGETNGNDQQGPPPLNIAD